MTAVSQVSATISEKTVVALEARLNGCQNVVTLGVRPNFTDYTEQEAALIREADKIYYPSAYYADMFQAMGKKTFPSIHTYRFVQDKIKQTTLFQLLEVPSPRTRFFYGRHKAEKILEHFEYPFVAKIPRGSALGRGVYLVRCPAELQWYCEISKVAYIQDYLPIDRDIRVVVIGDQVAHAYWRVAGAGEFRNNIEQGGEIRLDGIPAKARALALETAGRCGWNDVGLDICFYDGSYYVLEANMKYGKQGFQKAGIDYLKLMEAMIRDGKI
ncbi:MAG: ATP-grasp domain-containing protein [Desulfobacterales bacterium]|nr:ATP-grasp domain-containing protein [Desulfobacterales bacterium]